MNTKTFRLTHIALLACAGLSLAGCATSVPYASGKPAVQLDPSRRGLVQGVGIESHDIVSMTDRMMRDMLSVPDLAGRATAPRVIVDGEFFYNEGIQALNKNLITDRLRVALNRASAGRMVFVGRHQSKMVEQERALKDKGATDAGTLGRAAVAGGDYRLGGRISTLNQVSPSTGLVQRYNQITFEMIDLERDTIVWSDMYEFERAAADDVVYR